MKQNKIKKNKTKKNISKIKLWRNIKPKTIRQKKNMKKKYKSKCFLEPKTLKYPICDKNTGKVSCKGLNASNYYVRLHLSRKLKPICKYKNLEKKIKTLKKKHNCN